MSKVVTHIILNLYLEPKLIVNDHREPEHFVSNKNKCTAIYLCPCVFFELFRRDLNEAKAVSCNVVNYLLSSVNISHLPLCNYDAPITSQVSSIATAVMKPENVSPDES